MFVHASRIKKQLEYLQCRGIDVKPLYNRANLSSTVINDPEGVCSFEQYQYVLNYALEQSKDANYGLKFGSDPYLGGTLGMMCASCENVKEAFIQGCKFLKSLGNFSELRFIDNEHFPRMVYEIPQAWLLQDPQTAKIEIDAMFAFLITILRINSNQTIKPYQVNLVFDISENVQEYEYNLCILPNFNREENEIIFRNQDLLIPMKAFNPEIFQLLKKHMESQIKRFQNQESVSEQVKRILFSSAQYQFPDIETVASKLNLSPRTLQRQLSQENINFKSILQEVRFNLACEMLRQEHLNISEISYTLGYSDIGNFSRSFKKYVGMNPQEYKKQLL